MTEANSVWLAIVVLGVVALILRGVERAPIVDDGYEFRPSDEINAECRRNEEECIRRQTAA